jgi:hypothetical protein
MDNDRTIEYLLVFYPLTRPTRPVFLYPYNHSVRQHFTADEGNPMKKSSGKNAAITARKVAGKAGPSGSRQGSTAKQYTATKKPVKGSHTVQKG